MLSEIKTKEYVGIPTVTWTEAQMPPMHWQTSGSSLGFIMEMHSIAISSKHIHSFT